MPPTDPRIDAALAGEPLADSDETPDLTPALERELAELTALADTARAALAELCAAGPDPSEFAETFATAMAASEALTALDAQIPSSRVFSETFALRLATAEAMSELASAAPGPEDFSETFALHVAAGDAMGELRDASPPSERFSLDFEDHLAASELDELKALADRVRSAMDEVAQLAPAADAFAESFSMSFAARATPSSIFTAPQVIQHGPIDHRLEAAMAGDLPSRHYRQVRRDPDLSAQLDELEEIEGIVRGAMDELSQTAPSPSRFAADWVATCRHAAASPRPAASVRRPMRAPRTGTVAAMLIGVAMLGTMGFAVAPRIFEAARKNTAKGQIRALQLALIHYHNEYQTYPPSGDDSLVRYLDGDPSNGGGKIQFFPFHKTASNVTPEWTFLDPWGRAYRYRVGAGTHNQDYFDLWSLGPPDRRLQTKLANWLDELKLPKPPKLGHHGD